MTEMHTIKIWSLFNWEWHKQSQQDSEDTYLLNAKYPRRGTLFSFWFIEKLKRHLEHMAYTVIKGVSGQEKGRPWASGTHSCLG
jgi:hypothetical protein